MARKLDHHDVDQTHVSIEAEDRLGPGGAPHLYTLRWDDGKPDVPHVELDLHFQEGPIKEVGVNGITHEALLGVLIDRLERFQVGPFRCRENALALTKLEEEALHWLNARTAGRTARGVEGTSTP